MQEPQNHHMEQHDEGIAPPPRLLLWIVVGVFVLGIVGTITGIVVFRNVLTPGQQERVLGVVPFMQIFMPPRPAAGDTLPTPNPDEGSGISPADLLAGPNLNIEKTATATLAPTTLPATSTSVPTIATPEATPEITPTDQPTQSAVAPEPTAEVVTRLIPVSARLYGFTHAKQTWNNC
ncbi:MAG: hypothetical protein K8I60_02585, partial [Anaerolineae bacterium]|nr:hypothetical protein [Anaerolineae bacterium]